MFVLLKILAFILIFNYFSIVYSQESSIIPLPQKNLQNELINPVINENSEVKQEIIEDCKLDDPHCSFQTPAYQKANEMQNEQKEQNEKVARESDEKETEKKRNISHSTKSQSVHDNEDEGLFGSFRIGPMIGIGILMGPNISIDTKLFHYLGFSVSYGGYNNFDLFQYGSLKSTLNSKSNEFEFNTLTLNYSQFEGKISIYPFGGTFFIGAALGKRNITLNSTGQINATIPNYSQVISTPFSESIDVKSTYWTPQLGWLATWGGSFGWFAIGTELGVQLTLNTSVTTTTTFTDPNVQSLVPLLLQSSEYASLTNQIDSSVTNALKDYPLPYWNILKVGWMF